MNNVLFCFSRVGKATVRAVIKAEPTYRERRFNGERGFF